MPSAVQKIVLLLPSKAAGILGALFVPRGATAREEQCAAEMKTEDLPCSRGAGLSAVSGSPPAHPALDHPGSAPSPAGGRATSTSVSNCLVPGSSPMSPLGPMASLWVLKAVLRSISTRKYSTHEAFVHVRGSTQVRGRKGSQEQRRSQVSYGGASCAWGPLSSQGWEQVEAKRVLTLATELKGMSPKSR